MGIAQKLFSACLLICMVRLSWGQTSCISVSQSQTGVIVEGSPEYEVFVSNSCPCPQAQVIVKCFGLNSYEPVDPNAIKVLQGDTCVVNNGAPIANGVPVEFKYAWMTPFDFPVVSSTCNA